MGARRRRSSGIFLSAGFAEIELSRRMWLFSAKNCDHADIFRILVPLTLA
jgi:hypothetical protein